MTFRLAKKSTIFVYPSPSSSMISPASRASAAETSTISWPAPAQPTDVAALEAFDHPLGYRWMPEFDDATGATPVAEIGEYSFTPGKLSLELMDDYAKLVRRELVPA